MVERLFTILHVTHAGHPAGSTLMIHSLARRQSERGHKVLVGCRPDSLLAELSAKAGLPVAPLDFRHLSPLADRLAAILARERVDVVNSHDTRDRRALTWLRWRQRLPQAFVVTRHTMPLTSPAELMAVGLSADRTIAVGHAVAAGLRRRLYPAARLRVVPNGIDIARVDRQPGAQAMADAAAALGDTGGRPVVVILARRKDQHVFLRALTLLERPVVLACIGIDPDAELQALEARLPSRHRVVYVPFTAEPLAFYHLATVAALPSRIEGLSLALLEGMALGLPVVASRAGGNADLIRSGETGVLVPPLDTRAWAEALDMLLGDRALARRLGRAAHEFVRREHSLDSMVDRTTVVYREALQRRGTQETGSVPANTVAARS